MSNSLQKNLRPLFETKGKGSSRFHFTIFKPGGNDTGLISGIVRNVDQKKKIAARLQKLYPSIEQVGFVNLDPQQPELLMAGGEFCGNATSSAAYHILQGKPGEIFIQVSGVKNKLQAGVTPEGNSFSQMPVYTDPSYIQSDPNSPENALVVMEGITHYIDFNMNNIRGLTIDEIKIKAREEMAKRKMDQHACCGIVYVDQRKDWCAIHPIVYVRDIDTLFYETACGSGTTALGLLLAQKQGKSIKELPILQPSGLNIKVSVAFDGEKFGYVQIQSPIEKLYEGEFEVANTRMEGTVDNMLKSIIRKRPKLRGLITDQSILEYLRPALVWKQQKNIFPHTSMLSTLITSHIERLYGKSFAHAASKQLTQSWVIETGAHLHIPRRYNTLTDKDGAQINSLLFQGQVLWALAHQELGNQLSISLNSGRTPLDNTNSGAYLDLPALKTPMTLASKKKHPDSPQTFIPARTKDEINPKIELLTMYKKQKVLPEEQYTLGLHILENFLTVQSSFSDQIATTHALMMDRLLPIKQITLDSEIIGSEFILALLKDKHSLTYNIFADSDKREKFLEYLKDIQTGWTKNGSPFYHVQQKGEGFRFVEYSGALDPKTLSKGLEEKTLWPTGVMKFFALMVEGGILPSGGWTQTIYCTDIKIKSARLLKAFGYHAWANELVKMPTDIASVGPCWGIDNVDEKFQLLDAISVILNPSTVNLSYVTRLTGFQTFLIAAPTLYEFLLRERPLVNYSNISNISNFEIIRSSVH